MLLFLNRHIYKKRFLAMMVVSFVAREWKYKINKSAHRLKTMRAGVLLAK